MKRTVTEIGVSEGDQLLVDIFRVISLCLTPSRIFFTIVNYYPLNLLFRSMSFSSVSLPLHPPTSLSNSRFFHSIPFPPFIPYIHPFSSPFFFTVLYVTLQKPKKKDPHTHFLTTKSLKRKHNTYPTTNNWLA